MSVPDHLTIEDIEFENDESNNLDIQSMLTSSDLSDTERLLSALEIETIDNKSNETNSSNQQNVINSLTSSYEFLGGAEVDDMSSTSDFMVDDISEKIVDSSTVSENISNSSRSEESLSYTDIDSSIFQSGGFEYFSESSINNSEELPSAIEIIDM